MAKILLEMKNITKTFPGVKALDNVNFQVEEGEIHALVGENGAGKSTLMNVLSGIYPYGSYEGDIVYNGEVCKFNNIKDSEKKGIVIIHQELALVPEMSIGENMFLGNERGSKARINWAETYSEADKYLKMVGLTESSKTPIKALGTGKQQLVEIAKALAKHAKLLILDEPTSSLNETDSKALLDLMLEFKKQGMTMIIITHKLNEVSYVADNITVLRDGGTVETINAQGVTISEDRIIKGMVGREITDRFPGRPDVQIGDIKMEVKNWNVFHPLYPERKVVDDVSLYIRKGEVVGLYGLMGAGRTELAMSIFGQSYGIGISGELRLDGQTVTLKKSTSDAIKHKIAYVTEDRKGNGLVLSQSIKVNTSLANLDSISSRGVIDKDKEYAVAEEYRKKLKTKCPTVEQNVGNLSGGNQQKVLLAKWLFADPDILMLDEPTRGIDVGAKYEIYTIINDMVREGKSVLMISSELPEVLGMSDRIYIMNEGRIVGEMKSEDATQENIMAAIINSGKEASA
ncbi:multiple monosaccharide ABC transporter ATP-binding protein [Butyrivibrio sp. MC2013]|uniref:multiple monosaccharide ABC transporter ATP-binding protein n=1 Tax=Butyrivibrio sp. MC2013 TaxID=1280686 RepID=UPI000409F1E8|nr:multiple monosaccharide ABC transporter ATP-binding protein [Butyrivibrio sp. MC2013]